VLIVPATRVLRGHAAFAFIKDVSVNVTNAPQWSDADIETYLAEVTALAQRVPARASVTDFRGAMFGAHERRVVVDWLAREQIVPAKRTCLLASSTLLRGTVTAYAWMTGTDGAAFDPREKWRACTWVTEGGVASPGEVNAALEQCYRLLGIALV
jgi:hypothetical protein